VLPGLLAYGVVRGVEALVDRGALASVLALVLGGGVLGGGYVLLTRRMRVPEVAEVAGPVLRRLGLG
jgi:putative peptidoglycan lipid II flippase